MRESYDKALAAILSHEGGYVNHPRDPGGATNRGVTQRVYDAWRVKQKLPKQSVRAITNAEVMAIYKHEYWDKVKGDLLPVGLDYAMFDFAINSGWSRAAKFLQEIVGVVQDGQIGPATLVAVTKYSTDGLIDRLLDDRLAFLKTLETYDTFGKGWSNRVAEVRARAKGMADG